MDLRKKLKAFFTFESQASAGFTLVELIVVIAILAILGGVAVPAYSGYVKKADIAADQALLNAVNKAFAAACAENGTDQFHVEGQPALTLTNAKAVQKVTPYETDFKKYFAGNEDAKFKTDNAIVFDGLKGAFVLFTDGTTVFLKYGDDLIPVSAEDAKKLANSTFINAEGLGVEGLMAQVDFVAVVAASIDDGSMYAGIIGDTPFKRAFLKNLGVAGVDNMTDGQVTLQFTKQHKALTDAALIKMGYVNPESAPTDVKDSVSKKVQSNMAVLFAAQNTQSLTDEQINDLLMDADPKAVIKGNDKDGNKLAQAALYYGMYVAYAHSTGDAGLITATKNPIDFYNSDVLASDEFKKYVKSDKGQADLEAYRASMNIVVEGVNNSDNAVGNLVVNGFTDSELLALINQAVGK